LNEQSSIKEGEKLRSLEAFLVVLARVPRLSFKLDAIAFRWSATALKDSAAKVTNAKTQLFLI
jgi:hypothetical protein